MVKKLNKEIFIEKAKNVHGDKYNYSLVEYINSRTKIKIICPVHGMFEQISKNHLKGSGCSICNKNKANYSFSDKALLKHNNKYDYSLVDYIDNKTKIKIICPIHGEFEQKAEHHLNGAGCPICNESRGEREIKQFLTNRSINFTQQKRFAECRDKKPLPFDFYLHDYNTCIEFNGRQHYEPIKYWGGLENFKKQQKRDKIKKEYCKNNHIKLIIINDIKEIKNKLKWMN